MRTLQVVLFALGVLSFLASTFFIGQVTGDVLWRVGVAAILTDLACMRLWAVPKTT